jgi:hypothetical protein
MITAQLLEQAGIFTDADSTDCLWAESGIDWITANTTLNPDKNNPETIINLPAGAKLFVREYARIAGQSGIASESIEGLSQSFTTDSVQSQLNALALALMPDYFSAIRFIPKQQQWDYRPHGGEIYE